MRAVIKQFFNSAKTRPGIKSITNSDIQSLADSMEFTDDLESSLNLLEKDGEKISFNSFFDWWRCDRHKPESAALKTLLGLKCKNFGYLNRLGLPERRLIAEFDDPPA